MDISGAFALLDFHHPASSPVKDLILECFRKSTGVCKKERKKVLFFFLALEKGVILQHVWPTIKLLIMTTKGNIAATFYGSMFLGVWRKAYRVEGGEEVSSMIEELMQELLRDAIHCSKNALFLPLRTCLSSFVDGNRDADMHAMLRKVYSPVLFRSLRSANALVRTQSSVLFFDVFPLHDSHGSAQDDDTLLQRQFDLFSALLNDDDHRVRANAASGGCHILSQHWNSLPTNTVHDILTHLIKKLSVDNSSPNVRVAVLRGLSHLLESQPLSHNTLRKLLPFLASSIHDSSERVNHLRDMSVHEILSSDTLVAQLAVDANHPQVCFALTELLASTFFPSTATTTSEGESSSSIGPAQVRRCVEFVNRSQHAAEVFYAHLYKHVPVGRLVKFVVIISSLLFNSDKQSVNKGVKVGRAKAGKSSKRSRESADEGVVVDDPAVSASEEDNRSKTALRRIVLWILLSLTAAEVGSESVTLLVKYFSPAALREEIEVQLEQDSPDVEPILVWLRIASTIANMARRVSGSDDDEYPRGAVQLNNGRRILQHFAAHVSRSSSVTRGRASADSLVLSLCSLGAEWLPITPSLSNVFELVKTMAIDLLGSTDALKAGLRDDNFSWLSQNVFSRLSDPSSGGSHAFLSPGSEGLVGVVLVVLSDMLYLGVGGRNVLSDGEAWLASLTEFIEAGQNSPSSQRSQIERIGCVLSELCKPAEGNDLRSLGRTTLRLLSVLSNQDGEDEDIQKIKQSLEEVV
eukprot:gene24878-31267_t